jgi:tetratricopeptide (TPR) repeat protein
MKGQFDKSVADLTKYLNYNPNDAEYRFNRGLSYMSLKKYNEAINDFNLTLQSNPQFWQVYDSRSTAYAILGDTTRALADRAEFEKRRASAGRKK